MPRKQIYVRVDDLALWDRAVAFARTRRLTMSALIMNALQAYIDRPVDRDPPER